MLTLAAAAFICGLGLYWGSSKNFRLAWSGLLSEGAVIETQCDGGSPGGPSDCTMTYQFWAKAKDGVVRRHEGHAENSENFGPGKHFDIVYLPADPAVNGLPQSKWKSTATVFILMPLSLLCFAGSAALVYAFVKAKRA